MNLDDIRKLSSMLYGNADRLLAAAAIGRLAGKPISVSVLATESGLSTNRAQEQVDRFRQAGLLVPDHDPALRRKDYRPVDLTYWTSAAQLLNELAELEELT